MGTVNIGLPFAKIAKNYPCFRRKYKNIFRIRSIEASDITSLLLYLLNDFS
jgi:hypothetical protein